MKSKKLNADLKNTLIGKLSQDECDTMISRLLQDKNTVKYFVEASQKDGLSPKEIQKQLKYFGVKLLSR